MTAPANGPSEPRYLDRPEISEVFADRLEHLSFDGATVRMEFTVVRSEPLARTPGAASPKRWAYTSARVVLSPLGAADMLNKMQELRAVLLQNGVIQSKTSDDATLPQQDVTRG